MAAAPLIVLDRVSKAFGGGPALREVSLSIGAGEFVALVGPSGSGKTTTLKMLNRLADPDSGEVRIEGRPVGEQPAAALRRRIGYVFQGVGLFPHLSVGENIAVTPRLLGWPEPERVARTAELLRLVGLPEAYAGRTPDALSGGERQRVGVARALAARPKLMLMDEPFGALDPVTRDELGRAYRDLHVRLGLTTVMVTHDMLEALLLADRIVVMRRGTVVADATPADLLSSPADPEIAALIDTPRRQAERVRALAQEGPAHG